MSRINFLPPWVETNCQPAFYDKESGTVLQQTARMYAKVNQLVRSVNEQNETIADYIQQFIDLKDYCEDYFENLDVQEEINHKLDQMSEDGSLALLIGNYCQPLIDEQNETIAEFKGQVNASITSMNNQISALSNGSPLVASSTDDMTDTSKVYVNTSDGKWYYYDGDSWEIGGTYQSSGIADGSIDILMLKDDLQSNFLVKYSDPITLGEQFAGYFDNTGTFVSSTTYAYRTVSLTAGKIYSFTGADLTGGSHGLASIVIKNGDTVVYASNPENTSKVINYVFRCLENGLTAYISYNASTAVTNLKPKYSLRTFDAIFNQLKYTESLFNTILDITPAYIQATSVGNDNISYNTNVVTANMKMYQMNKGRTYKITCTDYSNICGLCVTDLKNHVIRYSSNANIGSNYVTDTYTFTAEEDGFIYLTTISDVYPTSIEVVSTIIDIESDSISPLKGKKITLNGDSICAGAGYAGGYGKIIGEKYNMTVENIGVGGATIVPNTYSGDNPRHWVSTSIINMNSSYDYAIVEGGVNDSSLSLPLGSISDGYDAVLDTTTYYGAFENMLKQLITRFKGKKYGYIAVHQMTRNYRVINDPSTSYYWASKKCCEKWGVPFLDLNVNVPAFAFFDSEGDASLYQLRTTYTKDGDGWHPNEAGYKKYYVDKIVKFLETL